MMDLVTRTRRDAACAFVSPLAVARQDGSFTLCSTPSLGSPR